MQHSSRRCFILFLLFVFSHHPVVVQGYFQISSSSSFHLRTRIINMASSTTKNNNNDPADEFGMSDDWADFEFDIPVNLPSSTTTTITTTTTTTTPKAASTTTTSSSREDQPAPKRVKVSPESTSSNNKRSSLEQTLQTYFGHTTFRDGQYDAIAAALEGQDVAVFWATGSGKSLCYQLPALHTGKITVVVSPLISLMQDQVHKLNHGFMTNDENSKPLATYLGSGQLDASQESKAMRGDFLLIYVTPEKLQTAGFLDRLSKLNHVGLIAIDESHCVSEWGHDFRKDYRHAGSSLRSHPKFQNVPIMALTATAVPRIQQDICENLQLRHPKICLRSFDRTNLAISVVAKDRSGQAVASAMEPLIRELLCGTTTSTNNNNHSTIIYAPTKRQVEELASYLQQRLVAEHCTAVQVEAYHAGMDPDHRQRVHTRFLTGQTTVIVATVAFGMGIDKTDTRQVIHYGPPKTVEEYYQQIGRAGRDGLPAKCILYTNDGSDFDKYHSDFYIGSSISSDAKQAMLQSLAALKQFALDKRSCRRKMLLDFFGETPSFGTHCGTCDNCRARNTFGADLERDFSREARLILRTLKDMREPTLNHLVDVLGGKVLEPYKYRHGVAPLTVKNQIAEVKKSFSTKLTKDQLREIAQGLAQAGYMVGTTKKTTLGNGYMTTYTVYSLTSKGSSSVWDETVQIVLPVPDSIREAERQQEMRRQRVLQQLEAKGIKRESLPQQEVETGDGDVIRAYSKWNSYLDGQTKTNRANNEERVKQLEELLSTIQTWRSNTAVQSRMAPGDVLAEHTLVAIAYTAATLPATISMEKASLIAAGARSRELDSLVTALNDWRAKHVKVKLDDAASSNTGVAHSLPMKTSNMTSVTATKWPYSVYKPQKKTGLATWEPSYNRFMMNGEDPQAIAMSPANGRPIQVNTVIGHIFEGMVQGRPVDLERLARYSTPPNQEQWNELERAEVQQAMSVSGDPTISGKEGGKFTMTDILAPIMGEAFVETPREDRTPEDIEKFSLWCEKLKWYMHMKRANIEPQFGAS